MGGRLRPDVGENGAGWVCRRDDTVREGYFDEVEARRDQHGILINVRAAVRRELPHVWEASDQRARRCELAYDVGEHVHLPPEDIDALRAVIEANGARALVSTVHAHAVPGSWDKATGTVRAMRDALSLDLDALRDQFAFIGDSLNDSAAFGWFTHTVGVSNAAPWMSRMPVPPRYLTGEDRGRGFAELASRILKARS
jgi:hydroxymethylpyrimidine pyrophosphatase-like HAD family hydrolase